MLTICELKLNLYTGMAGFSKGFDRKLLEAWFGNLIGIAIVALFTLISYPQMITGCADLVSVKTTETIIQTFVDGILCGVMMFIAVYMFRNIESMAKYLWIFLCVPIFIIAGFEHSMADMFYFIVGSKKYFGQSVVYVAVVSIANYIGARFANKLLIGENS